MPGVHSQILSAGPPGGQELGPGLPRISDRNGGQEFIEPQGMRRVTANKPFIPFSVRRGAKSGDTVGLLYEDVPGHMRPSLLKWVSEAIQAFNLDGYLQRRLQIDLVERSVKSVYQAATYEDALLLDVVDMILQGLFDPFYEGGGHEIRSQIAALVESLDAILNESSSAYAMDLSDEWHLTTRVDDTAKQAFTDAVTHAQHASGLLKSAWSATFKRDPNPTVAYRDAVLAVESVACETFIPNDQRPTLGKAINHLRDTLADWTVATLDDQQQASGATLLAMMRTVWQNHQRHVGEGGSPPDPASQQEAEAVLFLAVTIVQWFERGLVKRR